MKKRKSITLVVLLVLVIGSMAVEGTTWEKLTIEESIFTPFWAYLVLKPFFIRYLCVAAPLGDWISNEGSSFAQNFDKVILYNPPTDGILPFLNILLKILLPIYTLLIVLVGFYLLFASSSPKDRTNAKSMLSKLIITMVIISISPLLMEIIFTISGDLTESIFSLTGLELIREILMDGIRSISELAKFLIIPDVELGTIPFIFVYVLAWMPYMVICMRNIILTALMILFPLGILLYFIPTLKSIGKTILEQFLIWTFLQAFIALALVSVAKAFSVTGLVSNPGIPSAGWELIPVIGPIIEIIASLAGITAPSGELNLMTLGFGVVAYAVVIISPLVMVMLFRKFLP